MSAEFRFFLIDRNDVQTAIEEPVGWTDAREELVRSAEYSGFFSALEIGELEYIGNGGQLISAEFDTYGVEGQYRLKIEIDCGKGWELYYIGWLDFADYKVTCDCRVKITHTQQSDELLFTTRREQPVDLESLKAFDGETLDDYEWLGKDVTLSSKGIFLQNEAIQNDPYEYLIASRGAGGFSGDSEWPAPIQDVNGTGSAVGYFIVPFPFVKFSEQPSFQPPTSADYIDGQNPTNFAGLQGFFVNQSNSALRCRTTSLRLQCRVKGRFIVTGIATYTLTTQIGITKRGDTNVAIGTPLNITLTSSVGTTDFYEFDFTVDENVPVNIGDDFVCFMLFNMSITSTGSNTIEYEQDVESFVKLSGLSYCPPTTVKGFMVNEVLSRISEAYTGGRVRALSNYFERVDSEPYNGTEDSCNGLEILTNGLLLRQLEQTRQNTPPQFTLSFKDAMDGLLPIHNIGAGIEDDPNRTGFKVVRLEDYRYFWKDDVVFEALDIDKVLTEVMPEKIHGTVEIGYNRWESEQFNGLDEFLSKRIYRTTLRTNNITEAKVTALSKFIASGYGIEITRRQGNDNSVDWRYDNDTFVICMSRSIIREISIGSSQFLVPNINDDMIQIGDSITIAGSLSNDGTYTVSDMDDLGGNAWLVSFVEPTTPELAAVKVTITNNTRPNDVYAEQGNILNDANIIDVNTALNFRISPVRNLMRWAYRIFECYKNFSPNSRLVFASGDANYYAEGLLLDTDCRLEAEEIAENAEVSALVFEDITLASPIKTYEKVSFNYPVTHAERNAILANPYGLIRYTSDGCDNFGWLLSMRRSVITGLTAFELQKARFLSGGCCDYSVTGIELPQGNFCIVWDLSDIAWGDSGTFLQFFASVSYSITEGHTFFNVTAGNVGTSTPTTDQIISKAEELFDNDGGRWTYIFEDNTLTICDTQFTAQEIVEISLVGVSYSPKPAISITSDFDTQTSIDLLGELHITTLVENEYQFQVNINGTWTDVTDEVVDGTWTRNNSCDVITLWRIIDAEENVISTGQVTQNNCQ